MKAISLHVDETNYQTFKLMAAREGKPVAALLREAMTEYLKRKRPVGRRLEDIAPRKGHQITRDLDRSEIFNDMIGD